MDSTEDEKKIFDNTSLKQVIENSQGVVLEKGVEDIVIEMTNKFVTDLIQKSSELASHKKYEQVESSDINFCLENYWKIHPYRSDDLRGRKNINDSNPYHDSRMSSIKKNFQSQDKKKATKKA